MRCNLGKSVWNWTCDIFSFLFDWSAYFEKYILLKTLSELDQWFQSMCNWRLLRTIQNKRNSFHFLAMSHNQCFRLIPLDRNTNYQQLLTNTKCLKKYGEVHQHFKNGYIQQWIISTSFLSILCEVSIPCQV